MRAAVINLLEPSPQTRVEIVQAGDMALVEFAEKLIAAGTVPALQFALALGRVRPAVNEMDAQPGADPLQSFGAIGGAIINDQLER